MWSRCWWWHQYPISTNNFFSMHKFGKVFNLPWEIIDLKISNGFSNNCNIEKLLSADAIVTNIGITVHFFDMLKISIADIVSSGKINWVTLCLEIRSSTACCNISTGNIDQQSIIYMDFLTCGFDHHLSISSRHSSSTSISYTCVISLVQLSPCLAVVIGAGVLQTNWRRGAAESRRQALSVATMPSALSRWAVRRLGFCRQRPPTQVIIYISYALMPVA